MSVGSTRSTSATGFTPTWWVRRSWLTMSGGYWSRYSRNRGGSLQRPGKIICVGRNYAAHAKELGNAVPDKPLLFFKPPSSIIENGEPIVLPPDSLTKQVEHEGEVGVVIGARL